MAAIVIANDVSVRFVLEHQRPRSFQDALIELVHKTRDTSEEFWALKGVSFEVAEGEALGIVGQNGSGKSTLLKLLTRIMEPTSGEISVKGKVSALIELGAGFHPDLTGRENIYLNGSILGFSRKQMDRSFDEIVSFSELERFIDTPVKHYSSGMYVRLGFSVAINVDPDILVLDEILAVGDEPFQYKCLDRIADFRRRGKTILFVSHALQVVEHLCDQVLWLQQGVIQSHGQSAKTILGYKRALQRHDEQIRGRPNSLSPPISNESPSVTSPGIEQNPQLTEISLLSEDCQLRHAFRTGETLIVRLTFRACTLNADCNFEIVLRRSDGLLIYSTTKPLQLSQMFGTCQDITFYQMPILAGSYEFTGRIITERSECCSDMNDVSAAFSVWSDTPDGGIVTITNTWVTFPQTQEATTASLRQAELLTHQADRI